MWLQTLAAELPITLADGSVWLSIGQGLLFGAVCLLFGIWVARFVGLLGADAPAGETLGVGLASGLLVLTSWWAALASGGRSSFTPVAVGFAIAIGLAVVRRWRPVERPTPMDGRTARRRGSVDHTDPGSRSDPGRRRRHCVRRRRRDPLWRDHGASPRDGVQPLEFMDEAYYAVLGADLARTGTESLYSPSGFPDRRPAGPDLVPLGRSMDRGGRDHGLRHRAARCPPSRPAILVLAAAALTGTLVRRMSRTTSRGVFLFGFIACLFLAPAPLARGTIFGITMYGLAAVAVLLALYGLAVLGVGGPPGHWPPSSGRPRHWSCRPTS